MPRQICLITCLAISSAVSGQDLRPAKLSQHRTRYHDPSVYLAGKPRGEIYRAPRIRSHVSLGITQGGGAITFADITGDDICEAVHIDHGFVRAYDLDGTKLWDGGFTGVDHLVGIADIDADGLVEVVLGKTQSAGSMLVVLSGKNGHPLWRRSFSPSWTGYAFEMGRFDPSQPHHQIVVFYSIGTRNYVQCLSFERGASCGTIAFTKMINQAGCAGAPNFRMWDFDGDGTIEPVSLQHHSLVALDINRGDFKLQINWQTGGKTRRNYGPCYPADIDGDGHADFVVYGCSVEKHVTVLRGGNEPRMLWTKWLGYIWKGGDALKLFPPPQPPLDFDGDGKLDLLYAVYSLGGDNKHRLLMVDALTGQEKLNLIKQCSIAGAADVDGDEVSDALLIEGDDLVAFTLRQNKPREIFRAPGLRPLLRNGPRFSSYGGGDAVVWQMDVNGDGVPELFMQRGEECVLVTYLNRELTELWSGTGIRPLENWSGFSWGSDMNGDNKSDWLMRVGDRVEAWNWAWQTLPENRGLKCTPRRVWPPGGRTVSSRSRLLDTNGGGTPEVVTSERGTFTVDTLMGEQLHAASLPSGFAPRISGLYGDGEDRRARLLVKGPTGPFKFFVKDGQAVAEPVNGPIPIPPPGVECDVDGNGTTERLECTSGSRRLRARGHDGSQLWTVELPGNRYGFWVGRFLGRDGHDAIVTYPATEGRAGWMACFHGATGERAWAIDRVVYGKGADEWRSLIGNGFVWDIDGNGTDDVVVMCNDTLALVSGRDGRLLAPAQQSGVHWSPGIGMQDVDGDNVPEILIANPIGAGGVEMRKMDGTFLWNHPLALDVVRGAQLRPADSNADGNREFSVMLANGVFECWNGLSGETRWTIDLGRASFPASVNVADIDGDSKDEFIVLGADRNLLCLEEIDGKGIVSWKSDNGGLGWSDVRLVDIDCDDLIEIVATSLDGRVSVLE